VGQAAARVTLREPTKLHLDKVTLQFSAEIRFQLSGFKQIPRPPDREGAFFYPSAIAAGSPTPPQKISLQRLPVSKS
jgi:hypothetical protein